MNSNSLIPHLCVLENKPKAFIYGLIRFCFRQTESLNRAQNTTTFGLGIILKNLTISQHTIYTYMLFKQWPQRHPRPVQLSHQNPGILPNSTTQLQKREENTSKGRYREKQPQGHVIKKFQCPWALITEHNGTEQSPVSWCHQTRSPWFC